MCMFFENMERIVIALFIPLFAVEFIKIEQRAKKIHYGTKVMQGLLRCASFDQ